MKEKPTELNVDNSVDSKALQTIVIETIKGHEGEINELAWKALVKAAHNVTKRIVQENPKSVPDTDSFGKVMTIATLEVCKKMTATLLEKQTRLSESL